MKYINRAILANLHHRPLKPGRLIVLEETHQRAAIKNLFPWELTLFESSPTLFQSVGDFQHN